MPTIAPPAPAKAAAPPPAPSPAPTNGSPAESGDSPHMSESMRELEEMGVHEDRPAPKPPEAKKVKQPEAEEDTDAEAEPKDEKPKEKEAEAPKPPKAAELRTAYEKSKETIKNKDAEITRLQSELKTAKEKPPEDPEKKTILEKFEASDKRRQELEQEIRFIAYEKSEEFTNKYQKPYMEAWSKAVSELNELTVEMEDGTVRNATVEDMKLLANQPLGEARKLAKQMFGDAADDVMAHRRKIRELSDAQNKALDDAKKNAETHEKEQQTQSLQQRQKMSTLWQDENKAWAEKFPRWFKPEDGDEEGNTLLAKGYEMADAAFSNNGDKTPEERVKLHAELRNKAAAFPKLALKLKQSKARIKELEKSLKEFEQSEPPSGDGGKPRAIKPGDAWSDSFSELDSLSKK